MKAIFWFVGLFAVAVALALLMGQNSATVTLFWLPYRLDVSFNLALAVLLTAFVLMYASLRSLAALQSLPRRAAQWRLLRRERAVKEALLDALTHQTAGRFVRARSAARAAIDQLGMQTPGSEDVLAQSARWQAMAHLLAAEAAHSLRDRTARNREFASCLDATAHASDGLVVREGALLRAIRWALEDRDLDAATHWLGQLPQGAARRTLALRLKMRVARMGQDTVTALDTARLLAKHKAFSTAGSQSLLRGLFLDGLAACHDAGQVLAFWRDADATDRLDPERVLATVERLAGMAHADTDPDAVLHRCREWVLPIWNRYPELDGAHQVRLVAVMQSLADGMDASWLARIENMQRNHPADSLLQYLAADVFFRQQLWGKAQALFSQAAKSVRSGRMRVHAWVRLAELAEQRGDEPAALAAWREAAVLRLSTQGESA